MSRIHKLPDALANKIAAGEVVQRPASVIKELVENSIDAGATQVAVVVKNAGKSLIYINDNGYGMSEEDATLAFERHATSKITTQEDLERIMTLGFRGEALAAIASVAQVELKTRQEGDELGTLVRLENSEFVEVSKTATEKGTSIAVKNLFFTVPARRKFLKSNATEFKHIAETMQHFALSYPGVSFTLSDDDALVMNVKAGTLEDRIKALYNDDMMNALLPFAAEGDGVRATGYIGRPNFARRSKADQYLFMNGRHITSKLLSHAIYTGYEHLMDAQSYPPYILFLEIDPERVDVNVHPTKAEVKFDDENAIYRMLQQTTRTTLSEHNLVPAMTIPHDETGEGVIAALRYALPSFDKPEKFPTSPAARSGGQGGPAPSSGTGYGGDDYRRQQQPTQPATGDLLRQLFGNPEQRESSKSNEPLPLQDGAAFGSQEITIPQERRPVDSEREERGGLWQIHNKYIISQIRSGIMIVDQHVAHERILYEQALKSMEAAAPLSQQLLFPLDVKLPLSQYLLAKGLRPDLSALGFELAFEPNEVVRIYGVPNDVRSGQEGAIMKELLDQYEEYQTMGKTDQREMIAASYACKGAIKAGDPLSEKEMLNLIEELFATTMPYVCPHGRPIVIRLDLAELDRRFGRTS